MPNITVAALYQFLPLPDFEALKPKLEDLCEKHEIKGILLLAAEGINGTVAGTREAIDALKLHLRKRFPALEYKESFADQMPFNRMRVRLKKEIVTLGKKVDPRESVGTYVEPEQWNNLISDPEVHVVDVRNDYEVDIGSFKGAQNPETKTFREFPKYVEGLDKNKHKKIAMFCTGGIRCEKASSYMLAEGFKEVYHLKGGILKYVENVPKEESLWEGDCFVFDKRVAVGQNLALAGLKACYGCRRPVAEQEKESPKYERGVSCVQCFDGLTAKKRASSRERQKQEDLAHARGEKHVGATMGA